MSACGAEVLHDTDLQVLELLGEPGGWQLSQLAAKAKMPILTFEYRIWRLQNEGILKGWVYAIDSAAFNMLDYRLLVTMKQIDEATRQAVFQFCTKHLNASTMGRCVGSWDYEIGIEVESHEKVIEIVQSIYQSFGTTVRSIKPVPIFHCVKSSMFPFRAGPPISR